MCTTSKWIRAKFVAYWLSFMSENDMLGQHVTRRKMSSTISFFYVNPISVSIDASASVRIGYVSLAVLLYIWAV